MRSSAPATPSCWRSISTVSSSTSTSCSRAANACSAACLRTGRRVSPRFRRRAFTFHRITAPIGPPARGLLHWCHAGVRLRDGRPSRRGEVDDERSADRRDQRTHVWRTDPSRHRSGLGGRPGRSSTSRSLGLAQNLTPSRRPRCAVVDAIVRAPASGRLDRLPLAEKLAMIQATPCSTCTRSSGPRWPDRTRSSPPGWPSWS